MADRRASATARSRAWRPTIVRPILAGRAHETRFTSRLPVLLAPRAGSTQSVPNRVKIGSPFARLVALAHGTRIRGNRRRTAAGGAMRRRGARAHRPSVDPVPSAPAAMVHLGDAPIRRDWHTPVRPPGRRQCPSRQAKQKTAAPPTGPCRHRSTSRSLACGSRPRPRSDLTRSLPISCVPRSAFARSHALPRAA